ncbi:hypothetical protein FQR65_LT03235 [Abscondita terminalis]|nr:hypothetical protein FQR65_LT03235 [Abscondita terminalis]
MNDSDSANCSAKSTTDKPSSRRVSFASSNFIKKFAIDSEKNTIWDTTYEEIINSDSTHSSENAHGTLSIQHAEVHSVVQYQSKVIKTQNLDNQNQSNLNEVDMEITEIDCEDINRPIKSESGVLNDSLEYTCQIPMGHMTFVKGSNMTITESDTMELTRGVIHKYIPQQINTTTTSHVIMDQTCCDGKNAIFEKNRLKKDNKIHNSENQNQSNFNDVDMEITENSLEHTCQIPMGHMTYVKGTNVSLAESNSMELTQGVFNKFIPQQINTTTTSCVSMDQTCRDVNKAMFEENGLKKADKFQNQSNLNEVDMEITETSLEYTCLIPMGHMAYVKGTMSLTESNSMELTQGVFNKFIPQQINTTSTSRLNMDQTSRGANKATLEKNATKKAIKIQNPENQNQSNFHKVDMEIMETNCEALIDSAPKSKSTVLDNSLEYSCQIPMVHRSYVSLPVSNSVDSTKEIFNKFVPQQTTTSHLNMDQTCPDGNKPILKNQDQSKTIDSDFVEMELTDIINTNDKNRKYNNILNKSNNDKENLSILEKENVNELPQLNSIKKIEIDVDLAFKSNTTIREPSNIALTPELYNKIVVFQQPNATMNQTVPFGTEPMLGKSITRRDSIDFINDDDLLNDDNTLNYRCGHKTKEKVLHGTTTKCTLPNKPILKTSKYKESLNAQSSVELNCIDNGFRTETLNHKLANIELSEKQPHSKNSSYNFSSCTDDTQQLINYNLSNGQRKFGDSNFYANSKILLPSSSNSSGFPMSLENTQEVKENIKMQEFTDLDNGNVVDICKNNLHENTKNAEEFHISQESFALSDSILSNDSFLTIHQNVRDIKSKLSTDQVLKSNELLETYLKNNESMECLLKEFNQKMVNSLEYYKTLTRDVKQLHEEERKLVSQNFMHHSLEEIENNLTISDRSSFNRSNQESGSISVVETSELSELSSNLDEVLTVKEQIEKKYTRSKRIFKIITLTDNFCKVTTLYNTIQTCVHFTKYDGTVQEMHVNPSISEKSHPLAVLLHGHFIERLKEKKLRSAIGDKYDIFSLLDYIRLEMQKNLEVLKQYADFELEFNCVMDHNFKYVFLYGAFGGHFFKSFWFIWNSFRVPE